MGRRFPDRRLLSARIDRLARLSVAERALIASHRRAIHTQRVSDEGDVYDAARRRVALAAEVKSRERDGWSVVDRSTFAVTMVHDVRPPWWQMLVTLVLALFGAAAIASAERYLRIEAQNDGQLHRRTTGDIPRGWPRNRRREVPDGLVGASVSVGGDGD